ncbi:MAG TPA: hypothetical protein VES40_07890 [Ilumatobacteraceae bacterium]|nr:hypothetical protein [Ilumatobacteraceae bacterium]
MMYNTGIKSGSSETLTEALSVSGPQPGWMTLDEARQRSFTGEVVFEVDPEVLVYLDNGVVYYAERTSDASLGRRLLDAGVVDRIQLERGTVRVGDVEHLGRLFDREASIDRDAVLVVTENATADLIADLANHAMATVRVTSYRHHPSGVHRWFVAQADAQAAARHMGPEIAPVAGSQLLGLDADDGELVIQWNELADATSPLDASNALDVFVFDRVRGDDAVGLGHDVDSSSDDVIIEFGAAETPGVEADPSIEVLREDSLVEIVAFEDEPIGHDAAWPDTIEQPVLPKVIDASPQVAPAFTRADNGDLRFEMPALELSDNAADVDEVRDDVAAAVRRAIAAIEMATGEVPVVTALTVDLDDALAEPLQSPVAQPTGSSWVGFAPPTMATSAEVMYAEAQGAPGVDQTAQPSSPAADVASAALIDEQPSVDAAGDRSSALRRLIGSLRRKDH